MYLVAYWRFLWVNSRYPWQVPTPQKPHPDPQRSVLAGEPDPWVMLPMSIPTSILMSTHQSPRLVLSLNWVPCRWRMTQLYECPFPHWWTWLSHVWPGKPNIDRYFLHLLCCLCDYFELRKWNYWLGPQLWDQISFFMTQHRILVCWCMQDFSFHWSLLRFRYKTSLGISLEDIS